MELTALSYLDLIIQIAILCVLVLNYYLLQKKSKKLHGLVMTSVFITNTVLIVAVMLLPFLAESTEIFEDITAPESLLFLSHHVLGLITEVLGAFVVLRWIVKGLNPDSCKGKTLMRVTLSVWFVSILLGILLFIIHFVE